MLRLTHRCEPHDEPYGVLVLPYSMRRDPSLCSHLKSGEAVEVVVPRGTTLHAGDFLRAEDGKTVRIVAATEDLYRADFANALTLARAAYALGARHAPVQVEDGWLRTLRDPATRELLEAMGATVRDDHASFEPERTGPE